MMRDLIDNPLLALLAMVLLLVGPVILGVALTALLVRTRRRQ